MTRTNYREISQEQVNLSEGVLVKLVGKLYKNGIETLEHLETEM